MEGRASLDTIPLWPSPTKPANKKITKPTQKENPKPEEKQPKRSPGAAMCGELRSKQRSPSVPQALQCAPRGGERQADVLVTPPAVTHASWVCFLSQARSLSQTLFLGSGGGWRQLGLVHFFAFCLSSIQKSRLKIFATSLTKRGAERKVPEPSFGFGLEAVPPEALKGRRKGSRERWWGWGEAWFETSSERKSLITIWLLNS